jgi:hypothetical protein
MKIAGKDFGYYLNIIKLPLIVYLLALVVFGFLLTLFAGLFSVLLVPLIFVVVAGYVGWATVKKYGGGLTQATVSGIFFGLIDGILSVVLLLGMLFLVQYAIGPSGSPPPANLTEEGAKVLPVIETLISRLIQIIALAGIVIIPVVSTVVATVSSLVGGLLAKKI